uniref:C1 n=1 Tax=Tomato leaf curl Bangladesh betasatellite TaxID=885379 RepID=D5L0W7_9VIRU|nr:C1 [Tomato leaf curl Bangladesh betasatellite]
MQMTIKYTNEKGMVFTIDVKINEDNSILVRIELCSTRSPALAKKTFLIPYGHDGIYHLSTSYLEEGIHNNIEGHVQGLSCWGVSTGDMWAIDIMMMHEAPCEYTYREEYECMYMCVVSM